MIRVFCVSCSDLFLQAGQWAFQSAVAWGCYLSPVSSYNSSLLHPNLSAIWQKRTTHGERKIDFSSIRKELKLCHIESRNIALNTINNNNRVTILPWKEGLQKSSHRIVPWQVSSILYNVHCCILENVALLSHLNRRKKTIWGKIYLGEIVKTSWHGWSLLLPATKTCKVFQFLGRDTAVIWLFDKICFIPEQDHRHSPFFRKLNIFQQKIFSIGILMIHWFDIEAIQSHKLSARELYSVKSRWMSSRGQRIR